MVKSFLIAMAVGIGTGLFALNAFAAPAFKAGLWEHKVSMTMAGDGIPKGMGSRNATLQMCMQPTQEDWKTVITRMNAERGDCTVKDVTEKGANFSFNMSCKSGITGQVKGTYTPTAIHQSGVMSMPGQSSSVQMTYTSTARWKADSCPTGAAAASRP